MEKHCGNCANRREEINVPSKACEMCITAVLENGKRSDPSHWRKKPQTNADRIRAMSDEDLAWELMIWRIETEAKHHGVESNYPNTKTTILEWLRQPAEVD